MHKIRSDNGYKAKLNCRCGKGNCYQEASNSFYSKRENGLSLYGYHISGGLVDDSKVEILEGSGVYTNYSGYRITYRDHHYDTLSPTYGIYEDLDSIVVKGVMYKDILHHNYTQQENIPDWQHEAWYARNIYLVRFRLYDGTTWNLVKYHIVK